MKKTNVKKTKRVDNNFLEKGVTLVTLVITIVLMLILIVTGVNTVIDGKIFKKTEDVANRTNEKVAYQQNTVNELMGELTTVIQDQCEHQWGQWQIIKAVSCAEEGSKKRQCIKCQKLEVVTIPRPAHIYDANNTCTICGERGPIVGDYITYTPQKGVYKVGQASSGYGEVGSIQEFKTQVTDEEEGTTALEWRIFEITSDSISLMAATPTTQTISLKGANGYNNGVDILNDLCKDCYSNSTLSAEARSINMEDFYKKLKYTYTDFYTKFSRESENQIK